MEASLTYYFTYDSLGSKPMLYAIGQRLNISPMKECPRLAIVDCLKFWHLHSKVIMSNYRRTKH